MIVSRIMIISDSHGYNDWVKAAVKRAEHFDMLIHCGDLQCDPKEIEDMVSCPCYMVRGNCDYRADLPSSRTVLVPDHKIYIVHGHIPGVQYDLDDLENEAFSNGCDIALFGHTHRPCLEQENGITMFNPGSVAQPRQDSREKTYGILEIDEYGEFQLYHEVIGKK